MSRATRTAYTVEGKQWANMNGSHRNHHAHQALMDDWRKRALTAITAAGCQPVDAPVVITATVRRTTNARADAHNVAPSIKACIDAAVQAGLIEDDHDGIVTRLIIEPGPKAAARTIEIALEAC